MTFYAAGRRSDAAREWREVLAMEPANKFAKLYLRLISERGRSAQALALLMAVFASSPETFLVEEIPAYPPVARGPTPSSGSRSRG
jgi:hypothetical protein